MSAEIPTSLAWMFADVHAGHAAGSNVWIDGVAPAVLLLGFVCSAVWFAIWSVRRADLHDGGADDGVGNVGREGNSAPPGLSPDRDPEWWPEFERQFAAYVKSRLTGPG